MTTGPPKIDTRIFLSGHIGTVKFVGPVHGTAGVWIGVEWDDPRRGKHDGAKDGILYFSCMWVTFVLVLHLFHSPQILVEFLGQDHSFGRHPLSNTGQPSHELFIRNTLRISTNLKDKNFSSSVLPMEPLRSKLRTSIKSGINFLTWKIFAK